MCYVHDVADVVFRAAFIALKRGSAININLVYLEGLLEIWAVWDIIAIYYRTSLFPRLAIVGDYLERNIVPADAVKFYQQLTFDFIDHGGSRKSFCVMQ